MEQKKLFEFARANRKNPTEAEDFLWEHIRDRKLAGYKFRRQHPLPGGMIADFYCTDVRLIVEADGGVHLSEEAKEKDAARDNWSNELNIKVLRFTNEEILKDIYAVKKRILEYLSSSKASK